MVPIKLLADITMPKLTGPGVDPGTDGTTALEKIIGQFFGLLTIIAVIFFTVQIILAGYAFISSNGDQDKIKTSRKRLTEGALGLTIVVVAVGLGSFLASLLGIKNALDLNAIFTSMGL